MLNESKVFRPDTEKLFLQKVITMWCKDVRRCTTKHYKAMAATTPKSLLTQQKLKTALKQCHSKYSVIADAQSYITMRESWATTKHPINTQVMINTNVGKKKSCISFFTECSFSPSSVQVTILYQYFEGLRVSRAVMHICIL